jgi:uncharacterized protein YbjQ (UPF0145 family)
MRAVFAVFFYLFLPALLLFGGFLIGYTVERRHIASLEEREEPLNYIQCTNLKTIPGADQAQDRFYVDGQAVIASDYFKTFAMQIRNIFGGELRAMQNMMIRARREALVRMMQNAAEQGATHICNIRMETSTIGRGKGKAGLPTAEIHAYGTAIRIPN